MTPTLGQYSTICTYFDVNKADISILFEFGSDCTKTGQTSFKGDYIARIKRKGVFRFEDNVLVKRIK
jgi:hypothetical protein